MAEKCLAQGGQHVGSVLARQWRCSRGSRTGGGWFPRIGGGLRFLLVLAGRRSRSASLKWAGCAGR